MPVVGVDDVIDRRCLAVDVDPQTRDAAAEVGGRIAEDFDTFERRVGRHAAGRHARHGRQIVSEVEPWLVDRHPPHRGHAAGVAIWTIAEHLRGDRIRGKPSPVERLLVVDGRLAIGVVQPDVPGTVEDPDETPVDVVIELGPARVLAGEAGDGRLRGRRVRPADGGAKRDRALRIHLRVQSAEPAVVAVDVAGHDVPTGLPAAVGVSEVAARHTALVDVRASGVRRRGVAEDQCQSAEQDGAPAAPQAAAVGKGMQRGFLSHGQVHGVLRAAARTPRACCRSRRRPAAARSRGPLSGQDGRRA